MAHKVSINYLLQGVVKATVFDKDRKELIMFEVPKNEDQTLNTGAAYEMGAQVKNAYGITCNYYVKGEVSSSIYLNYY